MGKTQEKIKQKSQSFFDSISFCEKFEINFYLVSFEPPVLTKCLLAKLAREAQNPLAKMEFLHVCG